MIILSEWPLLRAEGGRRTGRGTSTTEGGRKQYYRWHLRTKPAAPLLTAAGRSGLPTVEWTWRVPGINGGRLNMVACNHDNS